MDQVNATLNQIVNKESSMLDTLLHSGNIPDAFSLAIAVLSLLEKKCEGKVSTAPSGTLTRLPIMSRAT